MLRSVEDVTVLHEVLLCSRFEISVLEGDSWRKWDFGKLGDENVDAEVGFEVSYDYEDELKHLKREMEHKELEKVGEAAKKEQDLKKLNSQLKSSFVIGKRK